MDLRIVRNPLFAIVLLICWGSLPCEAGTVLIDGDRMTLVAEGEPLQSLLHEFVEQGISVRIDPAVNPSVRASFHRADVVQALSAILRPYSHLLIWRKGPRDAAPAIEEIHIFRSGKQHLALPFPARTTPSPSPDKIEWDEFMPDEILVRPQPSLTQPGMEALLASVGGRVIGENGSIYRISLPEGSDVTSIARRLSAREEVAAVEPNRVFRLISTVPGDFPEKEAGEGTGGLPDDLQQQSVAVLDTGFDPAFAPTGMALTFVNMLDQTAAISDPAGHGTQMALIASGHVEPAGVAPDGAVVNPVLSIRVIDAEGKSNTFQLMQSIEVAVKSGSRIMSLSWGSNRKSLFLEESLDAAAESGIVILGAAGNEPSGEPVYPAAYDSVWGVGALKPDGSVWEYSNRGDFVALYAPGFARLPVGYDSDPGTYAGTSIATARAAHRASLALSRKPHATREELLQILSKEEGSVGP